MSKADGLPRIAEGTAATTSGFVAGRLAADTSDAMQPSPPSQHRSARHGAHKSSSSSSRRLVVAATVVTGLTARRTATLPNVVARRDADDAAAAAAAARAEVRRAEPDPFVGGGGGGGGDGGPGPGPPGGGSSFKIYADEAAASPGPPPPRGRRWRSRKAVTDSTEAADSVPADAVTIRAAVADDGVRHSHRARDKVDEVDTAPLVVVASGAATSIAALVGKHKTKRKHKTNRDDVEAAVFVTTLGAPTWDGSDLFEPDRSSAVVAGAIQVFTSTREQFSDRLFPASAVSLGAAPRLPPEWEHLKWVRSRDLWPGKEVSMFGASASPRHIGMRLLRDAPFVSALRVCAMDESRIVRLIGRNSHLDAGAIIVRLYRAGFECDVVVDDMLPVDSSGALAFSRGKDRTLWVPIVEKGFAKLLGSYVAVQDGPVDCGQVLEALTGAPVATFAFGATESCWYLLRAALTDSDILAAVVRDDAGGVLKGVAPQSALVIVGAYEIGPDRVLRIAHFASRLKWAGDKWSSLAKAAADPSPDDGTTVWMTFSEATALFSTVHALHWRPGALYGAASGALSAAPTLSVLAGFCIALFWVTSEAESVGAWVTLRQPSNWTTTAAAGLPVGPRCFGASFCVLHASDGVIIDGISARAEYGAAPANSIDSSFLVGRHLVIVVGDAVGAGRRLVLSVYAPVRTVVERAAISVYGACSAAIDARDACSHDILRSYSVVLAELDDIFTRIPYAKRWAVEAMATVKASGTAEASQYPDPGGPIDSSEQLIDLAAMLDLGDAVARQTDMAVDALESSLAQDGSRRSPGAVSTAPAAAAAATVVGTQPARETSESAGKSHKPSKKKGFSGTEGTVFPANAASAPVATAAAAAAAVSMDAERGGDAGSGALAASGGGVANAAAGVIASKKLKHKHKAAHAALRDVGMPGPVIATAAGKSLWRGYEVHSPDATAVMVAAVAEKHAATGEQFTDSKFPPQATSLAESFVGVSDSDLWETVRWVRSADVWPGAKTVMFKSISPRQLITRGLRDESFVSAVRVLALEEARVHRLISAHTRREAGCIVVRMFANGATCDVIVDDYLPCDAAGALAFSYCKDKRSLWLCFVEKAWAKLHGSYGAIDVVGDCGRALEDMTGAPVESAPFDASVANWQLLCSALLGGATVAASVCDEANSVFPGVEPDTALAIVGAHEMPSGERVLRVTHFLSRAKWGGDRWSADEKAAARPTPAPLDDGGATAWVGLAEARALFERVHVLHYHESWQHASAAGALAPAPGGARRGGNLALFWIILDSAADAWVSLRQLSSRFVEDPAYTCFKASFCVIRVSAPRGPAAAADAATAAAAAAESSAHVHGQARSDDGYVGQSAYGAAESLHLSARLRSGSHLVIVSGDNAGVEKRMMLSVYSSSRAHVERATLSVNDFDDAFKRACTAESWSSGNPIEFGVGGMSGMYMRLGNAYCIALRNQTSDRLLVEEIELRPTNVDVSDGTDGAACWRVKLLPGEESAIVCRVLDPGKPFGLGFDRRTTIVRVFVPTRACEEALIRDSRAHGQVSSLEEFGVDGAVACEFSFDAGTAWLFDNAAGARAVEITTSFELDNAHVVVGASSGSSPADTLTTDPGTATSTLLVAAGGVRLLVLCANDPVRGYNFTSSATYRVVM